MPVRVSVRERERVSVSSRARILINKNAEVCLPILSLGKLLTLTPRSICSRVTQRGAFTYRYN